MYIGLHNHTAIGSNIRGFLDSTNRVEEMVKYAKELGMEGIAITDHDSLTAHIDLLHYVKALKEQDEDTWANFKPICGNEIYLVSRKTIEEDKDYSSFYHFILIAKDMVGYQQLGIFRPRLGAKIFLLMLIQELLLILMICLLN